jgi:hypothetical protein
MNQKIRKRQSVAQAIEAGCSLQDLQSMVTPELIRLTDRYGMTLLHVACNRPNVELDVVKYLVKQYPDALKKTTEIRKDTPLGRACGCNSRAVSFLLDEYPQATRRPSANGYYPIHYASWSGVETDTVKRMVEIHPSAVFAVNKYGRTVLHEASKGSASPSLIRYLIRLWPVACLLVDNRQHIPLGYGRVGEEDMREVALAFLEFAMSNDEPQVAQLCRNFLLEHDLPIDQPLYLLTDAENVLVDSTKLEPFLTQIQSFLKDQQSVIAGIYRMNQAGRNYLSDDPTNRQKGVRVLEEAQDVSCLFWHLRESPSLFL